MTDVLKKMENKENYTGPLMIALQHNDLFDLNSVCTNTEALPKGRAFTFIKAVQTVNERLVEQNKAESLLFEVILIAKECSEEDKMKIVESVKLYGLEICKFYFCKNEELKNTLQSSKVKLFLSTDRDDVHEALRTGFPLLHKIRIEPLVADRLFERYFSYFAFIRSKDEQSFYGFEGISAALLYDQAGHHVLNQLKVIFSGDVIGFSEDSIETLADFGFSENHIETFKAAKIYIKEFAVLIGQMRKRFGHENSPICTCVLSSWGSRNIFASALKTLRDWGLDVDEAFCLAGAPCNPILSVVKPHILWDGGFHNMKD